MTMETWQGVVTILMAVLGTVITRFLPFIVFPESERPPRVVEYLGKVLPYAMGGLLVVYSLKNVTPFSGTHGIPGNAACCSQSPAVPRSTCCSCRWCSRSERLTGAARVPYREK